MKERALVIALLLCSACAYHTVNAPLQTTASPDYGYRFANVARPDDETFVIVTMSGGGTRAAAFAYGVLQKLAATKIHAGGSDLLDSVDVISSVSGGSFTATYYALNGRAGLPEFKTKFLEPNVERRLISSAFLPQNLFRLLFSRSFNRIDLAAQYYDQVLYHGATYAKMPRKRPYVTVNATEMDIGSPFQFTQEQFDPICSDLSAMNVSYAVASSSSFPVLLTPVNLRSYNGTCHYEPPGWFSLADDNSFGRRFRYYTELAALLQPERRYLHLIDGGVSDNIGVRGPYHAMTSTDTLQTGNNLLGFSILRLINLHKVRRVAIIVVDSKTENLLSLDKSPATPSLVPVILNIAETPMANYSFESVQVMKDTANQIKQDVATLAACTPNVPAAPYEIYAVNVTFGAVKKPATRAELNGIGTNYSLTPRQLQLLIDSAGTILDDSPDFQRLVKDLQH
jgi:NTE family protein